MWCRPSGSGSGPGWSQLPTNPLPVNLSHPISFWTGSELIVAGGYSSPSTYKDAEQSIVVNPKTVGYVMASDSWSVHKPMKIPGYEGLVDGFGAWTGKVWAGWATLCSSYKTIVDSGYCENPRMGVMWSPDGGWSVIDPPPDAAFADPLNASISSTLVGVRGSTVVFSAAAGYLVLEASSPPGSQWTLVPWPKLAGIGQIYAYCLVGDTLWAEGYSWPPGPDGSVNNVIALDLATSKNKIVLTSPVTTDQFSFGPICTEDSVLFQSGFTDPIIETTLSGSQLTISNNIVPEPDSSDGRPIYLGEGYSKVLLNVGLLNFSTDGKNWFLSSNSTQPTLFPPTPSLEDLVPAGNLLFARLNYSLVAKAAGQWFVLNLGSDGKQSSEEQQLGSATFPVPADTPMRTYP